MWQTKSKAIILNSPTATISLVLIKKLWLSRIYPKVIKSLYMYLVEKVLPNVYKIVKNQKLSKWPKICDWFKTNGYVYITDIYLICNSWQPLKMTLDRNINWLNEIHFQYKVKKWEEKNSMHGTIPVLFTKDYVHRSNTTA